MSSWVKKVGRAINTGVAQQESASERLTARLRCGLLERSEVEKEPTDVILWDIWGNCVL